MSRCPSCKQKIGSETLLFGLAKLLGVKASDFPKATLEQGIKVELEHTPHRKVAKAIALDHLAEDPSYYKKLAKMERRK